MIPDWAYFVLAGLVIGLLIWCLRSLPSTPPTTVSNSKQVETAVETIPAIGTATTGEGLTCEALEFLLQRRIKRNARPSFLHNPETKRRLELDGWDPISNIAVEFNGRQHYEFPNTFHTSERQFKNQVYRDNLKRELCDSQGIYLITVPYFVINGIRKKQDRFKAILNYIEQRWPQ